MDVAGAADLGVDALGAVDVDVAGAVDGRLGLLRDDVRQVEVAGALDEGDDAPAVAGGDDVGCVGDRGVFGVAMTT